METSTYLVNKNMTYNGMLACWHENGMEPAPFMQCLNKLIQKMKIINSNYFWVTGIIQSISDQYQEWTIKIKFFTLKGQLICVV